jgi:hypothetical protein
VVRVALETFQARSLADDEGSIGTLHVFDVDDSYSMIISKILNAHLYLKMHAAAGFLPYLSTQNLAVKIPIIFCRGDANTGLFGTLVVVRSLCLTKEAVLRR